MTLSEFQTWLNEHGASIVVDGMFGPATKAAILAVFSNRNAPAVAAADIASFAARIGCTEKQLRAVAKVESGGSGFDNDGRPKLLYERQYFWRLTEGRFGVSSFSNPKRGGYNEPSWEKLCLAAAKDPWVAFQSASWGKFQIMGAHWKALGYASPLSMPLACVQSEADHYDALARFIAANGLLAALRALSTNPETCRAFAKGYNGAAYEANSYHVKLAEAMR